MKNRTHVDFTWELRCLRVAAFPATKLVLMKKTKLATKSLNISARFWLSENFKELQ